MYIALTKHKKKNRFILRETCRSGDTLTFRNLFDLGEDPARFIEYPGGNAFYFDEGMTDHLHAAGANFSDDALEDLFWPWIRPDIRRAIETFKGRSGTHHPGLTKEDKEKIAATVCPFDKRRVHFLKFANMDQGPVENMPAALFQHLASRCRDEIEQDFLRQEASLKSYELKSYVYTVFNLQSHFQGFMAKKMPHVLDQQKVDDYFVQELCRLNLTLFNKTTALAGYLVRYAVMFFDHPYADTTLLDELAKDFMFRHHFHKPMPEKKVPVRTACKVFNITKNELKNFTKKQLTRIYRQLARKVHPDAGGSHDAFVELNNAYKTLMDKVAPTA